MTDILTNYLCNWHTIYVYMQNDYYATLAIVTVDNRQWAEWSQSAAILHPSILGKVQMLQVYFELQYFCWDNFNKTLHHFASPLHNIMWPYVTLVVQRLSYYWNILNCFVPISLLCSRCVLCMLSRFYFNHIQITEVW